MDFSLFVQKALAEYGRNEFGKYEGNLDIVPAEMKPFYRNFNPVCVQVEINFGDVRFCPAEDLSDLQQEYAYLNAQFIFATCNSDPIFLHDGKVYTCPHGFSKPQWEMIADSIEAYLMKNN